MGGVFDGRLGVIYEKNRYNGIATGRLYAWHPGRCSYRFTSVIVSPNIDDISSQPPQPSNADGPGEKSVITF
jgi:hypothetical protein